MLSHSSLDEINYSPRTRKSIGRRRLHGHRRRSSTKKFLKKNSYDSSQDRCAVCLDESTVLDTKLFPCRHSFHGECLIKWVKTGRKFNCPLCRQNITHFFQMTNNQQINNELVNCWNEHYLSRSTRTTEDEISKKDDDITKKPECVSMEKQRCSVPEIEEIQISSADTDDTTITDEPGLIKKDDEIKEIIYNIDEQITTDKQDDEIKKVEHVIEEIKISDAIVTDEPDQPHEPQSQSTSIQTSGIWENICNYTQSLKSSVYGSKSGGNQFVATFMTINSSLLLLEFPSFDDVIPNTFSQISANLFSLSGSRNYVNNNQKTNWSELSDFNIYNKSDENRSNIDTDSITFVKQETVDQVDNYDDKDDIYSFTKLNFKSGVLAGVLAGSTTWFVSSGMVYRSFLKPSFAPILAPSFGTILLETIPSVAMFFTSYEHFKKYLFNVDNENKSYSRTYLERFASAGFASSLAYIVPINRGVSCGYLPLRFASFFGTFELCKDLFNKQSEKLNLFQVASSAAIGGTVSHSVYYPLSQSMKNNTVSLRLNTNTNYGINYVRNGSVLTPNLYKGWLSSFKTFLPSCIVCSCAFEYSRRYFMTP